MVPSTILHLSDLHFCGDGDRLRLPWREVCAVVPRLKPDIVVVTGDLADQPRFVRQAQVELKQLASALRMPFDAIDPNSERGLIVLPGNHDVRLWGNVAWSTRPWAAAFGNDTDAGFWLRRRGIALYRFNSCDFTGMKRRLFSFARGRVTPQLTSFNEWCSSRSNGSARTAFAYALKIALVHHHPVPVSGTEGDSGQGIQQFVAMDDGGRFMRYLAQNDFGVVLHGHHHWPQFTELRHFHLDGSADSTRNPIPVRIVAGGSASIPHETPLAGFWFNMIRLGPDGSVILEAYARREGSFERVVSRSIGAWPERREHIGAIASREARIAFSKISKSVRIDPWGCADVSVKLNGGKVRPGQGPIVSIPIRVPRSSPGAKLPPKLNRRATMCFQGDGYQPMRIRFDFLDYSQGIDYREPEQPPEPDAAAPDAAPGVAQEVSDERYVFGNLELPINLSESSVPVDICFEYSIPNAVPLTQEQFLVMYDSDGTPEPCMYTSLPVDFPTDEIEIDVQFVSDPEHPGMHEIDPAMTTFEPVILISRDGPLGIRNDEAQWPLRRENQMRLDAEELVRKGRAAEQRRVDGRLELTARVPAPLMTARYFLKWDLPSWNSRRPETADVLQQIGLAERARDTLLANRTQLAKPLEQQLLGPFLDDMRREIQAEQDTPAFRERIEVGVAAFDPADRRLKFCAGKFEIHPDHLEEYAVGEGVVGYAFKMKQPLIWWPRHGSLHSNADRKCVYSRPKGYSKDHEAVLGIPLIFPLELDEPQHHDQHTPVAVAKAARSAWRYVVGVALFRSTQPGTALLRFLDSPEHPQGGESLAAFVEVVWRAFAEEHVESLIPLP